MTRGRAEKIVHTLFGVFPATLPGRLKDARVFTRFN
jgi:hypothetical protein